MSETPQFATMMPVVDRYRIKVVDGYMGIEESVKNNIELLGYFPNPAHGQSTIAFNSPRMENLDFRLMDLTGKEIFHEVLPAKAGYNSYRLDTSGFGIGIYFFRIGESLTGKLLVAGQ